MKWWPALIALCLCGCAPKTDTSGIKSPDPGSTAPAGQNPAPGGANPTSGPETKPGGEPALPGVSEIKIPPRTFEVVPPKTNGWKASKSGLVALGDKVDQAMAGVKEARLETRVAYEVGGNIYTGRPVTRIRNGTTFNIEYSLPETKGDLDRVISDGKTKVELRGEEWSAARPIAEPPYDAAKLEAWMMALPRSVLATLADGRPSLGPVLQALESGVGGFKAQSEERKVEFQGQSRDYKRVFAESKQGDRFELVIDEKRNLPVSARYIRVRGGHKDTISWSGQWQFGGSHPDKSFIIPATAKKP
ncbi:MAG: hypothetical protein KIT11_10845 [Fimbriimonadaceae bacterium]|nr:hypothetical protein [Fimbriimonadaceae bacterium]QYK55818.1 MAG: hypothetical protein KF733_12515 [Fimbriimonadaceae bacterium]